MAILQVHFLLYNFRERRINRKVEYGEDVTDKRKEFSGRSKSRELTRDEEVQRLNHKIQYQEQQIEFLKNRSLKMCLEHNGIIMNRSKFQKLMNKFGLFCPIRKANPARRIAKAKRLIVMLII